MTLLMYYVKCKSPINDDFSNVSYVISKSPINDDLANILCGMQESVQS